MRHSRTTVQRYAKLNKDDKSLQECTFCHEYKTKANVIFENETMFVIPNRVPYDMFEGQRVTDHFMVIPKRHVEAIKGFTEQEIRDQMTVLGAYEKKGYDVYARGVGNIARSVKHQHTHLIKGDNKRKLPRFLLFISKPYLLISK
jgi:diadenosine tetraphosphate (Ap4A) HIT family hydrolase